ncbi:Uncharacterised protein [Vibrio cholerae]|nr:Uncharacterised protein [Vibrio cholerae]CSI82512.1 Uncharacterised protein [Vibrio cholerae]
MPMAANCITKATIGEMPIAIVAIAAIALVTRVIESRK